MGKSEANKLTELLNQTTKSKILLIEWDTAIIVPLFKKGDTTDCNNYRGITFTITPGKILGIMEQWIKEQVERSIEDMQYEFRQGRKISVKR